MKKNIYLYIALALFTIISINSITFWNYLNNNKTFINQFIDVTGSTVFLISILLSFYTFFAVMIPKFIYFSIIKKVFNLEKLHIKYLILFSLAGYIPALINTIFQNIFDQTNLNFMLYSSEKSGIFSSIFQLFNIIDFISISIMTFLINKFVKGTVRDYITMIFGWYVFIVIITLVIEVLI